ncbi:unnamed protein product [Adineta steineri]|nr:unnamed protein product [Adineta steineri]
MDFTQLKLDKFWNNRQPSSQSTLFSNKNEVKASTINTNPSARWRPNQLPQLTKNSTTTTSMRTIQIIDPLITPIPTMSSLKHMQSAQNLFSIGKRMPEIEIALKQLIADMEKCPRPEQESPQPLSLRNVTLHGYQRHALAWMEWRETTVPFGGILADDMG